LKASKEKIIFDCTQTLLFHGKTLDSIATALFRTIPDELRKQTGEMLVKTFHSFLSSSRIGLKSAAAMPSRVLP
jgi:hypothetical protein